MGIEKTGFGSMGFGTGRAMMLIKPFSVFSDREADKRTIKQIIKQTIKQTKIDSETKGATV